MKKLFFDIETLPADEDKVEKLKYLYSRKLEKKSKKKEMSEEIEIEDGDAKFDDFFRNTSFDGAYGRVLCIGYAINDELTDVICNDGNEIETLKKFWEIARDTNLFVGHNIMDFDLKFIYQRSIILGIKPSVDLSFMRYRSSPIYDTMKEWSKWDVMSRVGLEHIALALGIPTPKEGIDGSQVYDFYKAGKVDDICEYCKRDVETTRAVYKKMVFES